MNYGRFEALIEKFPQVQIFSTESEDLDRVILHFFKQQKNVSVMSEAIQRKIQQALAPFWQQRFISLGDSEAPLVKNFLLDKKFFLQTDRYIEDVPFPQTNPEKLATAFEIADLTLGILERKLLSLSNGELRRVLLARLWMESPEWVYFNDLFGGLDPEFRQKLAQNVLDLSQKNECKVVVRLVREDEFIEGIPAFIYSEKIFKPYEGKIENKAISFKKADIKDYEFIDLKTKKLLSKDDFCAKENVLFDLKNVNVKFGDTRVIRDFTWQLKKGEHWAIMGENGAGKSTLLGLLTADHPQIYGNDILLLGERPGAGLNVWEHKAKIGFFSPELALQYREDLSLLDVLCTGFTTGLLKAMQPTWEEKEKARSWLKYLGFEDINYPIRKLSPIDKRLILMARAAIRPPQILLLDEPSQGLKGAYREKLFQLLELLSQETTLILVSHYEEEWPPCMTHLLKMPKFAL